MKTTWKLKWFEKLILASILIAGLAVAAQLRPTGYEAITIDNTLGGIGLTAAKYLSGSRVISDYAFIVNEGAQIRFTLDLVTVPTTGGVGTPLETGQNLTLDSYDQIKGFRAIRTGSSSSIKVNYFKKY